MYVVMCGGHRALCVVMMGWGGELVCGEWYVVCSVRGVGSVVGDDAWVGPGRVVQLLLPWSIPCLSAYLVSIPVSVMMVCC